MNSEELEQSLRAEFESYLKDVLAEIKQDVSDFQLKIESEFEKHRSQLGEVFEDFSKRIADEKEIETSFKESVTEHLKLARDEGARITAAAIAEAEEMREEEESPANFADIRDAINEISTRDSQSEILKSLVHHAAQYTPQGAFFIVKNKHLVGWRVFGTQEHSDPEVVKEVYFPTTLKTSLSESVDTLATVESGFGTHEDDSQYLEKLGFGEPSNMYSIPLVVRGRGVAVLHADRGSGEDFVNVEALESLVRVAGLTVEVLASANAASRVSKGVPATDDADESADSPEDFDSTGEFGDYSPPEADAPSSTQYSNSTEYETVAETSEYEAVSNKVETEYEVDTWSPAAEPVVSDFSPAETEAEDYSTSYEPVSDDVDTVEPEEESYSTESEYQPDIDQTYEVDSSPTYEVTSEASSSSFEVSQQQSEDLDQSSLDESEYYSDTTGYEPETESQDFEESAEFESEYKGFEPEASRSEPVTDSASFETSQFDPTDFLDQSTDSPAESVDFDSGAAQPAFDDSPVTDTNASTEPVVENVVSSSPVRARFGDRNVDLPIEVAEDERRYHNDARRFARLLVSEIKLYNEQKVKEGRETSNLYERLREAIDRSREMYDKRVQPPVAAKFDYFNYELVNTLAEGDEGKLGGGYPGANI